MRPSRIVSLLAILPVFLTGGLLVGCTNSNVPAAPATVSSTTSPSTPHLSIPIVSKSTQPAGTGDWGTIKGTVTWAEKELPTAKALDITKDQAHCLKVKKEILDNQLIVNPANKGVKEAVVFLMRLKADDPLPVHPSLKEPKEKKVEIDQPCCLFEPRVVALRKDQVLVVKNSSEITHNFRYENGLQSGNPSMSANSSLTLDELKPSYRQIGISCTIHPWMKGSVWVLDHPYFAVTDADGKYEIKNAPAGTYKIVFFHDSKGWLNNNNRFGGTEITVPAGGAVTADAQVTKSTD